MTVAADCYVLTKSFPREEVYGMVAQIRRAAGSIAANIAEGMIGKREGLSFGS